MDDLRWEPMLNTSEIGIAVKYGVVTLTGEVQNYLMKLATEQAAKGVKVVAQEVTLKSPFGNHNTDEQIGHAIVNAFT